MATTLPTFTVTDAQAQRLLGTFGSVAAYKAWLRQAIIDYVVNAESVERIDAFNLSEKEASEASRADLTASLPTT